MNGAVLIALCLFTTGRVRAADLAGRYVVALLPPKTGATVADAVYGGVVDMAARRHSFAITWHLTAEASRQHGIGLLENDNLLGVSLSTGGMAYGVAIYHHDSSRRCWRGQWITSIDSGGTPGEISFADDGSGLLGRHPLHCTRSGAGGFEGTVTITPEGSDYRLGFAAGGGMLYRGAGILLDESRLVVGWSFGSPPAVAAYRIGPDGLLSGHRLNLHGGRPTVSTEDFARCGDDAAKLLPPIARIDPALVPPDVDAGLEPDGPEIKTWVYEELMDRYNADGWAERWIEGQLTPAEHTLLDRAVRRRHGRTTQRQTIGDLIEQESRRAESD